MIYKQEYQTHINILLQSVCLFRVIVPLEYISLIWRRHHYRWRTAKFDLCSVLKAIEQWGSFSVIHLLWRGAFIFNCHFRGPVTLTWLKGCNFKHIPGKHGHATSTVYPFLRSSLSNHDIHTYCWVFNVVIVTTYFNESVLGHDQNKTTDPGWILNQYATTTVQKMPFICPIYQLFRKYTLYYHKNNTCLFHFINFWILILNGKEN